MIFLHLSDPYHHLAFSVSHILIHNLYQIFLGLPLCLVPQPLMHFTQIINISLAVRKEASDLDLNQLLL